MSSGASAATIAGSGKARTHACTLALAAPPRPHALLTASKWRVTSVSCLSHLVLFCPAHTYMITHMHGHDSKPISLHSTHSSIAGKRTIAGDNNVRKIHDTRRSHSPGHRPSASVSLPKSANLSGASSPRHLARVRRVPNRRVTSPL